MAEQSPYEKYASYCRNVVGIEPMPEELWEAQSNCSPVRLPGITGKQMQGLVHQTRNLRRAQSAN